MYSVNNNKGMRCYSCGDFQHLCINCPVVHFEPKKFIILKKINRSK